MTIQIDVQYRPRPGYGLSRKDAEIIGPVIEKLADEGRSTPAALVDEARPVASPIHHKFEWSDAVAGEAHRRHQARMMMRGIIIEVQTQKGTADIRAFYSMATDEEDESEREYIPVQSILDDPELVRRQLLRFRRDIVRLRDEYVVFASVRDFNRVAGPVLNAIDKTLEDVA